MRKSIVLFASLAIVLTTLSACGPPPPAWPCDLPDNCLSGHGTKVAGARQIVSHEWAWTNNSANGFPTTPNDGPNGTWRVRDGFCALSGIVGNFEGYSDFVQIVPSYDGMWQLYGNYPSSRHYTAYMHCVSWSKFTGPGYSWQASDQFWPELSIPPGQSRSALALSGITGPLRDQRTTYVDVSHPVGRQPNLTASSMRAVATIVNPTGLDDGQPLSLYRAVSGFYTEFTASGDRALISQDRGFCFLADIGGRFASNTDKARIYRASDGYWHAEWNSTAYPSSSIKIRPLCIYYTQ